MLYPKGHKIIISIMFATTSKGTIMEVRSTRSFNAIPATLIRGAFNLYLSNLLRKLYCKYFIYLSILLFYHCKIFNFVVNVYSLTYLSQFRTDTNVKNVERK